MSELRVDKRATLLQPEKFRVVILSYAELCPRAVVVEHYNGSLYIGTCKIIDENSMSERLESPSTTQLDLVIATPDTWERERIVRALARTFLQDSRHSLDIADKIIPNE